MFEFLVWSNTLLYLIGVLDPPFEPGSNLLENSLVGVRDIPYPFRRRSCGGRSSVQLGLS